MNKCKNNGRLVLFKHFAYKMLCSSEIANANVPGEALKQFNNH